MEFRIAEELSSSREPADVTSHFQNAFLHDDFDLRAFNVPFHYFNFTLRQREAAFALSSCRFVALERSMNESNE